jgi:hypothetical protein
MTLILRLHGLERRNGRNTEEKFLGKFLFTLSSPLAVSLFFLNIRGRPLHLEYIGPRILSIAGS